MDEKKKSILRYRTSDLAILTGHRAGLRAGHRTSYQADSRAGFAIAPILYMLGLIGIGAGVLFSGYSQILHSNVSVTNDLATKGDLQAIATTMAATSVLGTTDNTILCPPQGGGASANCSAAPTKITAISGQTQLPANTGNLGNSGLPAEIGVFAAGSGMKQLDAYGHYYVVCRWEGSTNPGSATAFTVISAGPDGSLQTQCGDTTAKGDDLIVSWPVATAIQHSAVWQTTNGANGTQAQFGQVGKQLIVDALGNITVPGTIAVAGASTFTGASVFSSTGLFTGDLTAPNFHGAIIGGSISGTTGTFSGNTTVGGTFGVTGTTTLAGLAATTGTFSGALSGTSGSFNSGVTVTSGDLAVSTGNATLGGTLGVTGNTTLGGTLTAGGTTLDSVTVTNGAVVGGSLGVTGNTTLGGTFQAGASTLSSATITNNASVGGSLSVTGNTGISGTLTSGAITSTDGTFSGTVTANAFSGPLTGNVTGTSTNVTGTVALNHGGTGYAASGSTDLLQHLGVLSGSYLNTSLLTSGLIPGGDIQSGTIGATQLDTTGVSAGTYNWGTVDANGRVTYAANVVNNSLTDGSGDSITATNSGGNGTLTFSTNNTAQMVLDHNGYLGLGTTTPHQRLDLVGNELIEGNPGTNREIQFASIVSSSPSERWAIATNGTAEAGSAAGSDFVIKNYDDTGTLIGTPFTIARATGNATFSGNVTANTFYGSGAGLYSIPASSIVGAVTANLSIGTQLTNANPQISGDGGSGLYTPTGSTVSIITGGSERLRVDASGNVDIGTTTAQSNYILTVNNGVYSSTSNNSAAVYANNTGNAGYGVYASVANGGASIGVFGSSPSLGVYGNAGGSNGTGVKGTANGGYGLYGLNYGIVIGTSYGIYGTNSSTTTGTGSYGEITGASNSGFGVYGKNSGTSNTGYAIYGSNNSASGWNIYAAGTSPNYFASAVAIGTNNIPTAGTALDLSSNTTSANSSLLLPVGTTGTRPSGVNGMVRYNATAAPAVEAYVNNAWTALLTTASNISSGLNLGTSKIATNPSISGDLTSGFYTPSSSTVAVAAGGVEVEQWNTNAGAVNYISVTPGLTGFSAAIAAVGGDTNVNLSLRTQGAGSVHFSPGLVKQAEVDYTASAVDYLTFTGGVTGTPGVVTIGAAGTDTLIAIRLAPVGTTSVLIGTSQPLYTGYMPLAVYNNNTSGYAITATGGSTTILANCNVGGNCKGVTGGSVGTSSTAAGVTGSITGTLNVGAGGNFTNTAANNLGYAVYATNTPATNTGINWGGYFETSSTAAAYGVQGIESGAANTGYAGYFKNTGIGATTNWGLYAETVSTGTGTALSGVASGSSNTGYAVYANNSSAKGWGVYSVGTSPNYFAGYVGIGTTAPTAGSALDLSYNTTSANSSILVPKGATSAQPTTPIAGMMRFNTTTQSFEGYDGFNWYDFGSGLATFAAGSVSAPGLAVETDTSTGLFQNATGNLSIATGGVEAARFTKTANAVNSIQISGNITGLSPNITAIGSDTNVNLSLRTQGTGAIHFSPGSVKQAEVDYTAGAVDYLTFTGGITGSPGVVTIGAAGTDTNISIGLIPFGTGGVAIGTTNNNTYKLNVNGIVGSTGGYTTGGNVNSSYAASGASAAWPYFYTGTSSSITAQNYSSLDSSASFVALSARNTAGKNQYAYFGAVSATGASVYTPIIVFGQSIGTSSYNESMRIDQNSVVGIGTTTMSSSNKLEINGGTTIGYVNIAAPTNGFIVKGTVGIGTSSVIAGAALDLSNNTTSSNSSLVLPIGTTGNRPTGANGMIRYNSTTPAVEGYINNSWLALLTSGSSTSITLGSSVTAANPAISGDVSSGLYTPSGSTVAFTTSGQERLRVDSSGNVDIGTTTAQSNYIVTVSGGINSTTSNATAALYGTNSSTSSSAYGVEGVMNGASNAGAAIYGNNSDSNNTGYGGYFSNATTVGVGSTGVGSALYAANTSSSNTASSIYASNNSTVNGTTGGIYNGNGAAIVASQNGASNNTVAIYAQNKGSSNTGAAIWAVNSSSSGLGIYAQNNAGGTAIRGDTNVAGAISIRGYQTGPTGSGIAVWGTTSSTQAGIGVEGLENGAANTGYGGYFKNSGVGNSANWGVYAETVSTGAAAALQAVASGGSGANYAINSSNSSTSGWNIYATGTSPNYFAGYVGIGTTAPTAGAALDLSYNTTSANSSILVPKGTTGAEPSTPIAGMMRFNTTTQSFEGYDGFNWYDFGSGLATFAAGSVSAPGLAVETDTSTGLFQNATGNLSVSTGGVEAVRFTKTASAVDYLTFAGGAAGSPGVVTIGAAGTDTQIAIKLAPIGTGGVLIGTSTPFTGSFGGLTVYNNGTGGNAIYASGGGNTINAANAASGGTGFQALVTGISGKGVSASQAGSNNTGYAVYGQNTPATNTGINWGGYFETSSTATAYGVQGIESGAGNTGYGGYFKNSSVTGANYGLYAETASTGAAFALKAVASGGSGANYAGYFSNSSSTGWGVYQAGTSPNYFAGYVGIGTNAPTAGAALDLSYNTTSSNSSVLMPKGTTGAEPTNPIAGMMRFNTTTQSFEGYDGFNWYDFGSGLATFAAGSVSAPGLAVETDTSTGLFQNATGNLSVSTGGVEAVRFTKTASAVDYLTFAGGAAGSPGVVTIGAAGTDTNVSITLTPKGSGYTLLNGNVGIGTASPSSALQLGSGQIETPIGTVSAPSYAFSSDANTGLYDVSTGTLGIAAGGVQAISIGTSVVNIPLTTSNTTNSTTTGALVVTGGMGVGGAITVGAGLATTGSNNNVYAASGSCATPPCGGGSANRINIFNSTGGSNSLGAYYDMAVKNSSNITQTAYLGSISNSGAAAYAPSIVIGQQTNSGTYAERMRIDVNGVVGIGTTTMSSSNKLEVNGAATIGYANTAAPSNGAIIQGYVGIGTTAPTAGAALDLSYNTTALNSSILVPKGTTGAEPSTPIAGMMRFNTTTQSFEGYDGFNWYDFGSGLATFAAGSVSAPGLAVETDTSTGLFQNATGNLSIATGGVEAVRFTKTASAVDYLTLTGGAASSTAATVTIGAAGTDTNVSITLTPKGSGYTVLNGNVGIGSSAPQANLTVNSSSVTSGNVTSITAAGSGSSGNALYVANTDTTNTGAAGYFSNATTVGVGSTGAGSAIYATGSSPTATTGYFVNTSTTGIGTSGAGSALSVIASGASNTNSALYVANTGSGSTNNYGIYVATNQAAQYGAYISGLGHAIYGNSSGARAIWGQQSQTNGHFAGVQGDSTGTNNTGYGVYGLNNPTTNTGINWGGYFETSSTNAAYGVQGVESGTANTGYGVYGINLGTSGVNYGVAGSDASPSGYGGYFTNTSSGIGLYASSTSGYGLIVNSGNVGIGTTAPTNALSFSGQAAKTIWMERQTTAATAGNSLTIQAGGAISGGTDLAGGNLILATGNSTGLGTANIYLEVPTPSGGSGTTDHAPGSASTNIMSIAGYSSGYPRVAIGTSIPSDSLTVIGNANGSGNGHIFVQNLNTSAASEGSLYIGVGTTVPANAVFSTVGSLWTGGGNGYTVVPAASTYLASIGNTSNGLTIGAFGNGTSSGILRFVAGGTTPSQERMRILANGNIGIGTTTPAGSLDIYGASNVNAISVTGATTGNTPIIAAIGQDTNISLRINTQGTGGIGINVAASTTNPLTVGSSSSNGNGAYLAAAGVWTNASDRRIKENIHPIQYGLDTVMKLDPVSYDMIGSHEHQVGFIAQQVLNVVPEVVGVPKNPEVEHYGLSYGNMVAVTVKAIQELKADNDNLRQQVNDLKGSAVRGQDSGIKNQELGVRSQNSDSIDRIIWIMCSGFTAILLMMGAIVLHTRRELHKLQKKLKKAS